MEKNQIAWVEMQKEKIKRQIESKGVKNLTEKDWSDVCDYIASCVEKAVGCEDEVRVMLHEFIEKYDMLSRS